MASEFWVLFGLDLYISRMGADGFLGKLWWLLFACPWQNLLPPIEKLGFEEGT